MLVDRAMKSNVDLNNIKSHVASLESQSKGACVAHFEWQPVKVVKVCLM